MKHILFIFLFVTLNFSDYSRNNSLLNEYKKGRLKTKLIYSIGGNTNNPDDMLIWPNSIGVDQEENLFILDSKESVIKKYNKNGKFIGRFGRKGRGPGEFLSSNKLGIAPNGNIYIYDTMSFQFCVFDNNGKFIKNIKFNDIVWKMRFSKSGIYIETQRIIRKGKIGTNNVAVMLYNYDLKKKKTIVKYKLKSWVYGKVGKSKMALHLPFKDNVYWDITNSSDLIVAYTNGYKIEVYSPEGKLKRTFFHKARKRKISEREKEKIRNNYLNEQGNSSAVRNFINSNLKFPVYAPYFKMMHIDEYDNLLLTTYNKMQNDYLIDVFNKEGNFINRIKIKADVLTENSIFKYGNIYSNYGDSNTFGEVRKYRIID